MTAAAATHIPRRIFMVGATGTIGRAALSTLASRGHDVVCFVRGGGVKVRSAPSHPEPAWPTSATVRAGDVLDPASIAREGFCGERFDAVVSCMASRTGTPRDAWAVDHQAHLHLLDAAKAAGVSHFVLLSAICVQKPTLAFQHAKLAFERALMDSGLAYSIVRPTAYFKSIAGQVQRVIEGKPFVTFGDGTLTACKPISDEDLATYLADCLDDPSRRNAVLPIGGPGPALTPQQQGELLFELLGREPRFRRVPVALLSTIAAGLGAIGRLVRPVSAAAEFARIGRYYATESMLVWDASAGRYDADATPETGTDTLRDYYAKLVRGEAKAERGEHAVF